MTINRTRAAVAYTALCVTWGSTYLAIRVGVGHLPPALFGGVRLLLAGTLILGLARAFGSTLPTARRDWAINAVGGVLLLGVGHGLVVWAEQFVTSGTAAIFVVTVSLWFAVFEALWPGGAGRPSLIQGLGLGVGFAGTVMLVGGDLGSVGDADWRGPVALTIAAVAWAFGSVFSQRRPTQSGPYVSAGIQMLAGGLVLVGAGTIGGEWGAWTLSGPGLAALAYLTVAGSLIGFTSYVYVLRAMPATVAGTYAYVNTVIAVLLGWLVLGETLTARTVLAMGIVIGAVIWVRLAGNRVRPPTQSAKPPRPALGARPSRPSIPIPAAAGIGDA